MKTIAPPTRRGLILLMSLVLVVLCAGGVQAAVEKVSDGVKFTYYDPSAGTVYLAGSFNGWNTNATPMVDDGSGNWTVILPLGPGQHAYKFVVDGGWITDTDNTNTKDDGYGGVNSVVEIDTDGEIVAKADAHPRSNTSLNPKVFIGGRYLSRTPIQKNVADDPRWRMQRPEQNVDVNFRVTISGTADGYARLRIDSGEKILQPNNIDAFLDEARISFKPEGWDVTGYHNMELLRSSDPYGMVGDVDLEGTIFDDHIAEGKGTSGLTVAGERWGARLEVLGADVYNFDILNDPNLYDDTGTDLGHARLSHKRWNMTGGANLSITRNMWWLNFTPFIGTPTTGIPRLDEHLARTGDTSDWFELKDQQLLYGPDLTFHLYDDKLRPQVEVLFGKLQQEFVTSNNSGLDFGNGPIDVPIFDRDLLLIHGAAETTLIKNFRVNAEHTFKETRNEDADENYLSPIFIDDEASNKQLLFDPISNPEQLQDEYSELEVNWTGTKYAGTVWAQRRLLRLEPLVENQDKGWFYDASVSPKVTAHPHDRVDVEVEQQYRWRQASGGNFDVSTIETIARGEIGINKVLAGVFDVRHLHFKDEVADESEQFFAPWAGVRYVPTKKVSLVVAYGVDPLVFDIDYEGRHVGREQFRREYMWSREWATSNLPRLFATPLLPRGDARELRDAEQHLQDAQVLSLRAIFRF